MTAPAPAVQVTGLEAHYGEIKVLHGISFTVDPGQLCVVVGLNGAGKTSTLKSIVGSLPPSAGRISVLGTDITGWRTERVVGHGVVLVPEGRHVFPGLTVDDNIEIGHWSRRGRKDLAVVKEQLYERFPRLRERSTQLAGTLSGGEQQMLAIARGLASDPSVLLVDECSLGLSPQMVGAVFAVLDAVRSSGTTVVAVEQNTSILAEADKAVLVEQGVVTYEGDPRSEDLDRRIDSAFFGVDQPGSKDRVSHPIADGEGS